jgi:hypothetical protein
MINETEKSALGSEVVATEKKIFLSQKLKSRISFIQLKPILDISLHSFSLSSCPQHSLKVLLL